MPDVRETLMSAIESHSSDTPSPSPSPSPEPSPSPSPAPASSTPSPSPSPAPAAPYGSPPAPGPATPAPGPTPPASPAPAPTQQQVDPKTITPAPQPNNQAADPTGRPPGTWNPAAREEWANVPKSVQQEVWRREREVSRAMSESTNARKFAREFETVVQPYLGFIAAENSTPMQAVQNLMQTAAIFRVGSQQQKVQAVAGLIQQFGVDLGALDAMLAGQQVQVNDPNYAIGRMLDQRLAPLMQQVQSYQINQQQAAMAEDQAISSELNQFAQAHEFYDDVKHIMADLIEVAGKHGQHMDLTQAYERATVLHEPVRRVLEARKQVQTAAAGSQAAAAARNASASIVSSPAAAPTVPPAPANSVRAALEHSIAVHSGGVRA